MVIQFQLNNKEDLKKLLEEAVQKDLESSFTESTHFNYTYRTKQPKDTYIEKLKAAVYREYLHKETNEFRSSIFREDNNKLYVNENNNVNGTGLQESPYNTIEEALSKEKDGDEIILMENALVVPDTTGSKLVIDKNIKISSLDGKRNLTLRGGDFVVNNNVELDNVNLSILKDGSITSNIVVENGTLKLSNGSTNIAENNGSPDLLINNGGNIDVTEDSKIDFENVTINSSSDDATYNMKDVNKVKIENIGNNTSVNIDSIKDSIEYTSKSENKTDITLNSANNRNVNINKENTNTTLILGDKNDTRSMTLNSLVAPNIKNNTLTLYINDKIESNTLY